MAEKKCMAVVGSGVSGIAALYSLRNAGHDVYLYERADRLGGHTNTVDWEHGGRITKVDTGFIVLNSFTYPNFIAFLKELGIETVETAMSFSVSRDGGAFEWSGSSPLGLFAQPSNLFSPSFYRMILDVLRFNLCALELLKDGDDSKIDSISIGEYLRRENYSPQFRDDYLLPMTACVWSTGSEKCGLEFPAVTLIRFMWNHHLLTVGRRPAWMTIPGGSKRYIDSVMSGFPAANLNLSTKVVHVGTSEGKCTLETADGRLQTFDGVVLACHGDEAAEIIRGEADAEIESEVLANFETTSNTAYLHNDISLLPVRRSAWTAWNYLTSSEAGTDHVSLTYNMNILQHIPPELYSDVLVTMNPPRPPASSTIQGAYHYSHPLYTTAAVRAQTELSKIQGRRGIYYAGAWTGYGFHEDGFTSGLKVGEMLGGKVPFKVTDAKEIRGKRTHLGLKHELAKVVLLCIMLWIDMLATVFYLAKSVVSKTRKTVKTRINAGYAMIHTGTERNTNSSLKKRNTLMSSDDTL